MVIWFIGLSGSGKTTLSKLVHDRLKPKLPNLVRLDGDIFRAVFGNDVDHTVEGRRKNAERMSNISKYLSDQGIHVIAAVLSIFPEWQEWNRNNIKDYAQVYIKASLEVLKKRDGNNLYAPALEGKLKNVVGVDIPFPEPANTDMVIDNNRDKDDMGDDVRRILSLDVIRKAMDKNK